MILIERKCYIPLPLYCWLATCPVSSTSGRDVVIASAGIRIENIKEETCMGSGAKLMEELINAIGCREVSEDKKD